MGIGGAMFAGGTAFSATSQYNSGKINKKIAENNATVLDWQADDVVAVAAQNEKLQRIETRRIIGSQRAALGAQGIEVNDGSSVDIQVGAARIGEVDARTIRANAAMDAWGIRSQATDQRYHGYLMKQEGTTAALGTILGNAGSALMKKYGSNAQTTPKTESSGSKSSGSVDYGFFP